MDIRLQNLEPDCFYHIYNRGINGNEIFKDQENFMFFIKQFIKYMIDVCEVYSYCLMPNHFHFVIKVKSEKELLLSLSDKNEYKKHGLHSVQNLVSKQISRFISSYTQSYNKVHKRHGALFESPFKRKKIDSIEYLRNVIIYVNQNPTDINLDFKIYKFYSYTTILSLSKRI
ncbi:transposase [Flavobacterium psychroterrae]|uniref:transposase n=1 Tax=Flavobacterium psychroterrae TaxID=2133767 RepID=UPI001FD21063|nr:transposase [Flavobacterium psychroterrae]